MERDDIELLATMYWATDIELAAKLAKGDPVPENHPRISWVKDPSGRLHKVKVGVRVKGIFIDDKAIDILKATGYEPAKGIPSEGL